jgi:hypothetical protein
MTKDEAKALVQRLKNVEGFDKSTREGNRVFVRCSQCEATVINNVACHENGCPNKKRR